MAQEPVTESLVGARAATQPPVAGVLRAVYPPELTWVVPVEDVPVTIGRSPDDGSPPLRHGTVSRRHVGVWWDVDRRAHVAADLGSRHGTEIDGNQLQQDSPPLPLADGVILHLGDVFVVYELRPMVADPPEVSHDELPGESSVAINLRAAVARAAADPSPVLLIGETGTGKEWIARELHRLSRRNGPMVAINCAALAPQLVESQLFGHIKGAFTGATVEAEGVFRAANGGTLLLDEIGELPLDQQPKLLRALQDGQVQAVGATRSHTVDVRVVAATNRDLAAEVEAGRFRRDLYARLAKWELRVPPLRARRGDLLAWIHRLHRRWCRDRNLPFVPYELTPAAVALLLGHPWRDNLRGVDRMVHDLAARVPDPALVDVDVDALPPWLPRAGDTSTSTSSMTPIQRPSGMTSDPPVRPPVPSREEFEKVFRELDGNVRAMARHFGRDRRQIYRWLDAYGLRAKEE